MEPCEPSCHLACLEATGKENKHAWKWQYIEAGKIIDSIFMYRMINWFIEYRPRRTVNDLQTERADGGLQALD